MASQVQQHFELEKWQVDYDWLAKVKAGFLKTIFTTRFIDPSLWDQKHTSVCGGQHCLPCSWGSPCTTLLLCRHLETPVQGRSHPCADMAAGFCLVLYMYCMHMCRISGVSASYLGLGNDPWNVCACVRLCAATLHPGHPSGWPTLNNPRLEGNLERGTNKKKGTFPN